MHIVLIDLLPNQKDNFKKHYRYNLLAYKSINYENKKDLNYLAEDDIIDMEKSADRKYFDWSILSFCLRKKVDIESWIDTGRKNKKNTKTRTNKYKIIDKIDKKKKIFLTIHQDQEVNSSNQKKKNLLTGWE